MLNTVFSQDDPISGVFDVEATARVFTRAHLVKGMFFNRLLAILGASFGDLVPSLQAPPRLGKYLPFSDYPQGDYLRVASAVALRAYPAWPLREGIRRLSRDDFKVFADSTLGRVLLAVVGDVHAALLNVPSMYMKVASADWKITGEEIDKGAVRITFAPVLGPWEFQLGQLEGVVLAFGKRPSVRVVELPKGAVRFDVRHDDH
jgi:uncharacterized protein (TIGR02265 family)